MLGVSYDVMKRAIYEEYGRLLSLGGAKPL
jgi:hypothetical protein